MSAVGKCQLSAHLPQGSILGLTEFNVLINELVDGRKGPEKAEKEKIESKPTTCTFGREKVKILLPMCDASILMCKQSEVCRARWL